MRASYETGPTAASRWTTRIAAFSVLLLVVGIVLHRFFGMSTPIAMTIIASALVSSALALLIGTVGLITIWRTGIGGTARTITGMLVAGAILVWPVAYVAAYSTLPRLNDITTDTAVPPEFETLAARRAAGANDPVYPGDDVARRQATAYPDLKPFVMERSSEEAFEIALDALKRLKIAVVTAEPPDDRTGVPGRIEAVDRTPVLGFSDDVVLRVVGDARNARVDIRSASRYGSHDFGRNAQRTRLILKELQTLLESTLPGTPTDRVSRLRARSRTAIPKRAPAGDRAKAAHRKSQDPALPDARRAPAPKATPPSPDPRRSRDTRG